MRIDADAVTNRNAARVVAAGVAAIRAGDPVMDFSAVRRCDSSAVAVVLAWARAARAAGRSLRLEGVPDDLRSLAHLYGLDAVVGGFFADPGSR